MYCNELKNFKNVEYENWIWVSWVSETEKWLNLNGMSVHWLASQQFSDGTVGILWLSLFIF